MSGDGGDRSGESLDELRREVERLRRVVADREAELERMRAGYRLPDEYLTHLSHQLRGPLTGILLWTDLLRADLALADSGAAPEAFDAIRDAAKALLATVENVRDPTGTGVPATGGSGPSPVAPSPDVATESGGAAGASSPHRGAKVLLAEDVLETRQALATVLTARGYRVLEAADGEAAVRLAREQAPDVVLMDIAMPRVDGISALDRLRADPATAALPVAAVTARVMSDDRQRMEAAGFDAFLVKPFRIAEMIEVLDRLLARGRRPASPA